MFYYYSLKPKYNVSISLYCKILITDAALKYLCFLREGLIALTSDPLQMQIVDQIF